MNKTSTCRHSRRAYALTPLAFAMAVAGGNTLAANWVYTTSAQFGTGTLVGVNTTAVADQLQLDITGSSFPVLWIANAGEDTLSKVDSTQIAGSPGREIARYRTWFNAGAHAHDAWNGAAPSRTAVDKDGNAYVANRGFQSAGYPGWAYVFKIKNTGSSVTSSDANNDGIIQASEMMPLVDNSPANNIIDPAEIKDERIAWAVRVPDGVYTGGGTTPIAPRQNALARALCIGTDGNLWVGMYNNYEYWKISSVDGHTIAGPVPTGNMNYGCLIDQNGTLWGANWDSARLTRIDNTASNTGPYTYTSIGMPNAVYGLALRRDASNNTHVIMGGSCNSYVDYDAFAGTWTKPARTSPPSAPGALNYCTYAVGTDNGGNILVSKQSGGVVKFDPTGAAIWDKGSQVGGSDSRGVIADANNDIWQVHRGSNNMAKYRGSDGASLGVVPVGFEPYTYSDASGTAQLSITTKTGNWSVVSDSGAGGTSWGTLSWNANLPSGTSVSGEARAADTLGALGSAAFQPVANGGPIGLTGRYVEAKVTLNANPQNVSPVVLDVTVSSIATEKCDVDGNNKVDINDINAIMGARGQRITTANQKYDIDGDGVISVNDARGCVLKCTNAKCVP